MRSPRGRRPWLPKASSAQGQVACRYSFFDRFLKGCDDHLLDGNASQYPITFVRQPA
jgi:hypothetical protein